MPHSLTFMMGKFPAILPTDRRYARNHMWAQPAHAVGQASSFVQVDEGKRGRLPYDGEHWRFGFTAYAVRLMQDVYFLDWHVSAGDEVQLLQEIGHIETSKAVADLFGPIAGTLAI